MPRWFFIGVFLYKKGKLQEAIEEHKKAIKILLQFDYYPSLKIAYENLNLIYLKLQNIEMAKHYKNISENVLTN